MELTWLETFIKLAESSSMRTAAAELGISPATASERLSALEDELGAVLLHRGSKGSELTEAGRLYLESAKKLLNDWEGIATLVKPLEKSTFLHLSIGLPGNCMPPVVGRFLDEFIPRHPEIELSLYTDEEIGIAYGLRSQQVDIFFAFEPSVNCRSGLILRPVHHTRMGVLIPSDHRLAFRDSASLSEFDGDTFLLYPSSPDTSMEDYQKKLLKNSGIRYILYGGHFSQTQYQLPVKMGCGTALYPRIKNQQLPPKTVYLELTDDKCQCEIYMLHHPENHNPALQLFLEEFGDTEGTD